MKAPCLNCCFRYAYCHANCKAYINFTKRNARRRDSQSRENDFNSFLVKAELNRRFRE